MLSAQPPQHALSEMADVTATVRVLVAPFKNIWLALPMAQSRKIIRFEQSVAALKMGDRLQIDDFSAQVCLLYEHIYGEPNPQPETHGVVMHRSTNQSLVIPMVQVPTIVNLPKDTLQPILADYRHLFLLEVASHITQLPQTAGDTTVFLLDIERLFELLPPDRH